MVISGKTTGERIRRARGKLKQSELAKKANVHTQSIVKWEADKSEPSIENIKKIANALNISPIDLAFGDLMTNKDNEINKEIINMDKEEKEMILKIIEALNIRKMTKRLIENN